MMQRTYAPNYSFDDLGRILLATLRAIDPDIECHYKDFRLVVEVTLDSSKNQWFREGQPVMRHLREYSQFWIAVRYEYDGRPQKIVPMDFQQFGQVLDAIIYHLERYKEFTSTQLLDLLNRSVSISGLEGYNQWCNHIRQVISQWCEAVKR
jgi:hypothetical protein